MKISDAHTHPYTWVSVQTREKARSAMERERSLTTGFACGDRKLFRTLLSEKPVDVSDALIKDMDKYGIHKSVILSSVFHVPNEFLAEIVKKHPDRLFGFGRWLFGAKGEEAARQVEEAIEKYNLCGIGEVALFEFYPTPPHEIHRVPEFRAIMDKISELKVPVLFDSGWSPVFSPLTYFDPFVIDDIANEYPDSRIIIGHAGKTDTCFFEHALMVARKHANVFLELSYQTAKSIERAVNDAGAEKCMFGTDWAPRLSRHETQLKALMEADISEVSREQIAENVETVLDRRS